jgi:hypothetical protein
LNRRPAVKSRWFAQRLWAVLWLLGLWLCGSRSPSLVWAQSSDAALIQTLRSGKEVEARRQAAARLSKIDVTIALEPLMKALLADRSPLVRAACADALVALSAPAALSALRAATHDEDPAVRKKAEAAVEKLDKLAAEPVEKMVVFVVAPPAKPGKNATNSALLTRAYEEITKELQNSGDIELRDDLKSIQPSDNAFSIESTISNLSRRTTPRGELEVSCDLNVTISLLPGKRVVGIVSGGASTFSPRDSAARVTKAQAAELESQALTQSVQAATENLLSFLRGQRKTKTH